MKGINKVTLLGNLSGDAEYRVLTNNGAQKAVSTVSLATNETFKDAQGNTQEKTEWHKLVFWDKLADVVHNYTHKGSKVYVEGKLRTRSYQDKNGNDRYITEIQVTELVLLDSKSDAQPASQQSYPQGYTGVYTQQQTPPQGLNTSVYTQQQNHPQGQHKDVYTQQQGQPQGYAQGPQQSQAQWSNNAQVCAQGNGGGYMPPPQGNYRQ